MKPTQPTITTSRISNTISRKTHHGAPLLGEGAAVVGAGVVLPGTVVLLLLLLLPGVVTGGVVEDAGDEPVPNGPSVMPPTEETALFEIVLRYEASAADKGEGTKEAFVCAPVITEKMAAAAR